MKLLKVITLLLLCSSIAWTMTNMEDIKTITLKNGMKIILLEDHSIPNANMYFFWKVGSRNEYPGITGLSHFFEHMMFNGAKKYGPKIFDRVMEANGGSNNAYTSENVTVYTDWFPTSSMEVMFDLEADRIKDLAIDSSMVESERGVVTSERVTGLENSNWRFLNEQVKATAFFSHPYRWSVIGYESDIKNWSREDLQNYFDIYYAPNNAVVVMVGDFKVDEVTKMAKQYFEPIPANKPPRPVHTTEPEQLGEKRVVVHKDVSSPNILLAYHVPEARSDDYYALDMLDYILSDGRSSRLYNSLIDEKEIAVDVFTYYPVSFDPNLFYIYAVCSQDVNEDSLEAAIYEEINKIIKNGITEKELQKVKNKKLVDFYNEMETINGKANTIGDYEVFFGDYKKLFTIPEDYNKVTTQDIKRVVEKYFKKSNRTVGVLKKNEEN